MFSKIDQSIKSAWLTALRSGKYSQCKSFLHHGNKFCCLGVLCDLVKEHPKINRTWRNIGSGPDNESVKTLGDDGQTLGIPPMPVRELAGLTSDHIKTLVQMNDTGISFTHIANYIETNF